VRPGPQARRVYEHDAGAHRAHPLRGHCAPASRGGRQRAGALGAAGPTPRTVVLRRECAGCSEDRGNPPDRAYDVEAEEALRLDGAPTTPVVPNDRQRSLQVGGRERGE
jgi:hypothetical protein